MKSSYFLEQITNIIAANPNHILEFVLVLKGGAEHKFMRYYNLNEQFVTISNEYIDGIKKIKVPLCNIRELSYLILS